MTLASPLQNSAKIFLDTHSYIQQALEEGSSIESLKTEWAQGVLNSLKVDLEVLGTPSPSSSLLLVGNHVSYLDIPLLMSVTENISFVAKKEISDWPVIGKAASAAKTVFVKRDHKQSRNEASQTVKNALMDGKRIVIFPSGTTCTQESKPWKKGAFRIAFETGALIQPFRIKYKPVRTVAYIDDDIFLFHLYNLCKSPGIQAQIEFHPPVTVTDVTLDSLKWHLWSKGIVDWMSS